MTYPECAQLVHAATVASETALKAMPETALKAMPEIALKAMPEIALKPMPVRHPVTTMVKMS